ncbi:MAG: rod shape-determining protein MreC [Rhodobacteraceae bacterium]|nr:rod shape-determining protein MreC [Paracoccaceae bacterium]
MARDRQTDQEYGRSIRRVLIGVLVFVLLAVFVLWRIDNPRVEQFRAALVDRIVPNFQWALVPAAKFTRMVADFQSYANIYEQNQELRRELQRLKGWREAALQLEQKNAKLLDLNHVRIDAKLTFITGVVLTDSGSPFRQSALINVGRNDGVMDGWATMDGLGLVGRISGVGDTTSRVVLLTDSNSRIPVVIQPSGQKAILAGNNTPYPVIEFLESPEIVHPGDRVVSSGDGKVFPPGLLAGQVVLGRNGRLLVQPSADFQRLEFLRVLRAAATERIGVSDELVGADVGDVASDEAGNGR